MPPFRRSIPLLAAATLALAGSASAPALAQTAAPTGAAEATSPDKPGLTVSPGVLVDRTVAIRGRVEAADAGRPVRVERQLPDTTWAPIATATVAANGSFRATWKADAPGRVALRALVDRGAAADGAVVATAAAAPLTAELTVFEPFVSSWYGPGFFGRKTACGQRLRRSTVGVAHKTLPCGTIVDVYYKGRTLSVPVIDRGPFKKGRDWDLTQAAAEKLGVKATVRVGALSPVPIPAEDDDEPSADAQDDDAPAETKSTSTAAAPKPDGAAASTGAAVARR